MDNGYRAFAERYFTCKTENGFEPALPVTDDAFMKPELVNFMERVLESLDLAPVATTYSVVNAYTGPKRKTYLRAQEKYHRDGLSKKDAWLKNFVKFEKQDLSKAPRCISPREAQFNLVLGKYLKFNEKKYFQAIATAMGQEVTVIKGVDIIEQASQLKGMWDRFGDCVAVGGDAKKFDMHVSRVALEYEHLFYLMPHFDGSITECLLAYRDVQRENAEECPSEEGFPELSWLLSQQLHNVGTAYFDDGKLSFEIDGTRASGDLNTSLGNCLLMCAMSDSWAKRAGTTMSLGNNGDDCITFMERESVSRWLDGQVEYYAELGFRMELEAPVYEFENSEFCQSKPVKINGKYRMVRNPLTLITKASMCLQPITSFTHLRKWMMAVGTCEGSLSGGVPVLESFARALRRNGVRCSGRLAALVARGTSRTVEGGDVIAPIDFDTRLSFFGAWGITPAQQLLLEKYYDSWTLGHEFGEVVPGWCALDKDIERIAPATFLLSPDNF